MGLWSFLLTPLLLIILVTLIEFGRCSPQICSTSHFSCFKDFPGRSDGSSRSFYSSLDSGQFSSSEGSSARHWEIRQERGSLPFAMPLGWMEIIRGMDSGGLSRAPGRLERTSDWSTPQAPHPHHLQPFLPSQPHHFLQPEGRHLPGPYPRSMDAFVKVWAHQSQCQGQMWRNEVNRGWSS